MSMTNLDYALMFELKNEKRAMEYNIGDRVIFTKNNKEYIFYGYRADPEFIWLLDKEADTVFLTNIMYIEKKEEVLRVCRVCGFQATAQYQLDSFVQDSSRKYGCRTICNECNNQDTNQKRRYNKVEAIKYKGSKCTNCSIAYDGTNASIFDFHHVDPTEKEYPPTKIMGWSWANIKKEIDKCDLLCSNCHRLKHNEEY